MTFNKTLLTATMLTLGGFAAMSANAATTDSFDITLKVDTFCDITSNAADIKLTAVNNGTARDGTSSIDVTCSKGTEYTLALSPTGIATDGSGVLKGSLNAGAVKIPYQLSRTDTAANWGSAGDALTAAGAGVLSPVSHGITVKVAATDTDVAPDDYSDTVAVLLTF